MQPLDFLQTAEFLSVKGQREPDWRSSISRSYYALYWMLSAEILRRISLLLLQSASLCRKDHMVHERLPIVLKASSDAKVKEFGVDLENLRLARLKADYDLRCVVSQARASEEYQNARDLRDEIHNYGIPKLVAILECDLRKVYGGPPSTLP